MLGECRAVSFAREGLDESQAHSMVDMDRTDDPLGRAAFPDRQVLVLPLFLGEPTAMHDRKLFPGTR